MSEFVEKWEFFGPEGALPIPEFWAKVLGARHMVLGLALDGVTGFVVHITAETRFGYSGFSQGQNRVTYVPTKQSLSFYQFMCLIHIVEQDDDEMGTPRPEAPKEDEDVGAGQPGDPEEAHRDCSCVGECNECDCCCDPIDWGPGR